jgi:exodeoxyribonuclease-3
MKLATWNVNSIRARTERVLPWLLDRQPDVLCMQELKTEEKDFPIGAFRDAGYDVVRLCQRTYNGVAIASRRPLTDVTSGLDDGEDDPQARLIAATVDGVRVVSVYVPNGQAVGTEKYAYKLRFLERLRGWLEARCDRAQPLVVAGDFNVAPEPRDVHDPAAWENETLFHIDSRAALERVRGWGLTDTLRLFHEQAGLYSWWDYRMLGFPKNRGLRIDHIFVTDGLAQRCTEAWIDREARKGKQPSDHAPVLATFGE